MKFTSRSLGIISNILYATGSLMFMIGSIISLIYIDAPSDSSIPALCLYISGSSLFAISASLGLGYHIFSPRSLPNTSPSRQTELVSFVTSK